jgi:repressor LexA
MLTTLTKRQKEILDYVRIYSQLHGFSPSMYEIKDQFKLSAVSTVHEHLQNLKNKGLISKEINQARSIRAVEGDPSKVEMVEVPVIYSLTQNENLINIKNSHNIFVHRDLLNKADRFFAIEMDTALYKKIGIFPGDILIVKEDNQLLESQQVLATSSDKKYLLGLVMQERDYYVLAKLDEAGQIHKRFSVKATMVTLIRRYS